MSHTTTAIPQCKECFYFRKAGEKMGNCFFDPPSVQFIPFVVAGSVMNAKGPEMQMTPASARPMVQQDHFCHNHTIQEH